MSLEAIGTLSGLANVWLTTRQNIWCWPVGLVYIFVSYVVFFKVRLYAELGTNTVYLILTFYGWYYWLRGGKDEQPLSVTRLRPQDVWLLLGLNLLCVTLMGAALDRFTNNAFPYVDSAVAMLSYTAMGLQAKKKLENWVLWCVVNVVSMAMYMRQGIFLYAALCGVFLVLAIRGHELWKRSVLR